MPESQHPTQLPRTSSKDTHAQRADSLDLTTTAAALDHAASRVQRRLIVRTALAALARTARACFCVGRSGRLGPAMVRRPVARRGGHGGHRIGVAGGGNGVGMVDASRPRRIARTVGPGGRSARVASLCVEFSQERRRLRCEHDGARQTAAPHPNRRSTRRRATHDASSASATHAVVEHGVADPGAGGGVFAAHGAARGD